ncbi:hypothetical protein Tco_0155869 [Tanacetum coccineum]
MKNKRIYVMSIVHYGGLWFGTPVKGKNTIRQDVACPVDLGDARRLEADQLIASGDRARMVEMIYSLRLENLKVRAMLDIERDRMSSLRLHMSLSQEEFRQIRSDRDDARGRLRRPMVRSRTMTNTRSGMTHAAIEEMIDQRVNAALEAHQVNQNLELRNNNGNNNGQQDWK